MTQEDKKLLLTDLCARLPYHCRVFYEYVDDLNNKTYGYSLTLNTWCIDEFNADKAVVKPYLRSMSSMTEEERDELEILCDSMSIDDEGNADIYIAILKNYNPILFNTKVIDWFNSHHFDYRGLIEKGLALEAPEGMYN